MLHRISQFYHRYLYYCRRCYVSAMFKAGMGQRLLQNRSGKRLLAYHGIDDAGSTRFNTRFISKDMFEQHIAYFKQHFHVVSLAEYFSEPAHPSKLTVAITFDDGYLNNLTHALPVLEKYDVPASFFITGVIDSGQSVLWADLVDVFTVRCHEPIVLDDVRFVKNARGQYVCEKTNVLLKNYCKKSSVDFKARLSRFVKSKLPDAIWEESKLYWQQLSVDDIHQLAQSPLVTIGSHGYYHNNLGDIALTDAEDELKKSKLFLETVIGKPIDAVAFPCGSYTEDVLGVCDDLGFAKQLAADYLYPDDPAKQRLQDRVGINPFVSFNDQMSCILKGSYY